MKITKFWIGATALLVLAYLATHFVTNEFYLRLTYTVLQFVVLASAWNILGGNAGYVNFGGAAFFAMGTYSAALLIKSFDAPMLVQIIAAGVIAGAIGFITGILTLRLRGIFFSIATVALSIILETIINNSEYLGGAKGLQFERPAASPLFPSYPAQLFFVMACLAVGAVAIARYVENSWIGRGLRAIRDNEEAAECTGVPTLKLKLIATTLCGALMGIAGAPYAMLVQFIEPASAFNLNYSVSALAMPIIGGTSSWLGPVIGAILLGTVQQVVTVTLSSELNVLILGLLLVFFVVAAPEGILGLVRKLKGTRK